MDKKTTWVTFTATEDGFRANSPDPPDDTPKSCCPCAKSDREHPAGECR